MYIVNSTKLQESLESHGYNSITDLANDLDIHRNTIHYYLSGQPVIAEKLEMILDTLELTPSDAFIKKKSRAVNIAEPIAYLVDKLHDQFPHITFVLFGSRAKGIAKKYSDWDLGAYSKAGIPFEEFIELQKAKSDLEEKSPYMIQITNLCTAEESFLSGIARHLVFLTGRLEDWIDLQKKGMKQ